MKKPALPFVMIASLFTLVSCGNNTDLWTTITPVKSPTVTGVVIESSAPSPGIMTGTPDPGANSSSTSASVVPVAPVAPVVVTRKQTVSYSTPEADASVEFDVTITDGIITAASSKLLQRKTQPNIIKIALQKHFLLQ